MKKILVAILMILSVAYCSAQVDYSTPGKKEIETYVFGKFARVKATNEFWMTIVSDNRYEDYVVKVRLGEGYDQTISSLEAIIKMIEEAKIGDEIKIQDMEWTISFNVEKIAIVQIKGHAGNFLFGKSDLNLMLRKVKKMKEREITK